MAAKDNMGDQFRLIHHFSNSAEPPHLVEHPVFGGPNALQEVRPARRGANETIFGTEENDITTSYGRSYKHTYKVPESAISPEIYADDDESDERVTSPDWQKRPQLWQQVPASRLDALKRGKVIKFVNEFEGIVGSTTSWGIKKQAQVKHALSYILPKPHLSKLGIEYQGVTKYESKHGAPVEPVEDIEKRIKKSYGKDAI